MFGEYRTMLFMNPAVTPCIVLLEDDPLVRFGQEVLLRDWGYRVVAGRSRAGVLDALEQEDVEVAAIIADFNLGNGETGVDVACDIAASASRPIPTVIMSASHGRSSCAAARKHGFTFLAKPINPDDLQAWLTDATALPE
jgi:two-component system, sensor histidine kinase